MHNSHNSKKTQNSNNSLSTQEAKETSSAPTSENTSINKEDSDSSGLPQGTRKVLDHLKAVGSKQKKDKLETGQFIINEIYGGNYELAQEKEYTKGNNGNSIAKVIEEIEKDTSGEYPSKTWTYDSVNLAIDNHLFEKEKLISAYGKLGISHQTVLTSVKSIEMKNQLINEIIEEKLSVAKLKERIKEKKKSGHSNIFSPPVTQEISVDTMKHADFINLKKYINNAEKKQKSLQEQLNFIVTNLEKVRAMFKEKTELMTQADKKAA